MTVARSALLGALLLLPSVAAGAAEPVRHISIYVQPYYEAAESAVARPKVSVGASFNPLLASARREDILAARDKVLADPKLVTPMTMMVLAIRLYDVGLRDDAAFWFYAAKDRVITLLDVVDADASGLSGTAAAMKSFVSLAGPFINGYAFCDIANQQAIRARELDWVETNPYGAVFLDQLKALPGDRAANLTESIASIREGAAKERDYFKDPKNLADFTASRKKNEMDEKFCWK